MQSCSSAFCVLILLIITFTAGSESAVAPVKVKLMTLLLCPALRAALVWSDGLCSINPEMFWLSVIRLHADQRRDI
ncbi:hypothetical protein AOLI_G00273840 [Acnodon oligacanthus]